MRVAIPTENGQICPHFGHCEVFTVVDLDPETNAVGEVSILNPPPHKRGVIPAWLHQLGCTHIIAGGMGGRALALFEQYGIHVVSGAPSMQVDDAVSALIEGKLTSGANPCNDPSFKLNGGREGCNHD